MTTSARIGGSWEDLYAIHARIAGAWKELAILYARVSGVWEIIHNNFAASSNDSIANAGIGQTQTESITITPTGGKSPYTYSWVYSSGSAVPTISSATSQTVHWNSDGANPYDSTWNCTVTDAWGQNVVVSQDVRFLGP